MEILITDTLTCNFNGKTGASKVSDLNSEESSQGYAPAKEKSSGYYPWSFLDLNIVFKERNNARYVLKYTFI